MIRIIDEKTLRAYLFGLAIECPFGARSDDCVFHKVRNLTTEEKFNWVQRLSYADAEKLYSKHLICSYKKEEVLK